MLSTADPVGCKQPYVAHRRQRDAVPLRDRERLHLAERARPRCNQRVGRLAIGDARRVVSEAWVVDEVMRDHHMHERGMLEWIEHDEIGRIVVPTTPLRIHGADPVDTVPSPKLGQHNREIYGDWLGLSAAEIATLEEEGVI